MFGSAGIFYDHIQGIDVAGQSLETALFFVFEQMNFSFILSGVSVLLILTFFVTSADSATFVLGMQTHNGSLNPPFFVKLAWGIVMVAVAAILMWSGGVDGLQAATIITGLPLTIILLIMTWGLLKSFSADLKAGKK